MISEFYHRSCLQLCPSWKSPPNMRNMYQREHGVEHRHSVWLKSRRESLPTYTSYQQGFQDAIMKSCLELRKIKLKRHRLVKSKRQWVRFGKKFVSSRKKCVRLGKKCVRLERKCVKVGIWFISFGRQLLRFWETSWCDPGSRFPTISMYKFNSWICLFAL